MGRSLEDIQGVDQRQPIKQHTLVAIDILRPHPQNYRNHPDDELEHIMASLKQHGFYRNIVVGKDNTILAGHGVVEAARRLGYTEVPVIPLDYTHDDPRALKLLVGDNEIAHLVESDDRALTEILRNLSDMDELLGTGYDDMMLANLVMVTRPGTEIKDLDEAAQWVGLPDYDGGQDKIQIIVNFSNAEDCRTFCTQNGLEAGKIAVHGARKAFWWPPRAQDDSISLRFTSSEEEEEGEEEEEDG